MRQTPIHLLPPAGVYRGKKYDLVPGQAFIIRPGEETTYKADDEDPWSYMWVGFHGYRSEDFIEAMGYSKDMPIIKIIDKKPVKRLRVAAYCRVSTSDTDQLASLDNQTKHYEKFIL